MLSSWGGRPGEGQAEGSEWAAWAGTCFVAYRTCVRRAARRCWDSVHLRPRSRSQGLGRPCYARALLPPTALLTHGAPAPGEAGRTPRGRQGRLRPWGPRAHWEPLRHGRTGQVFKLRSLCGCCVCYVVREALSTVGGRVQHNCQHPYPANPWRCRASRSTAHPPAVASGLPPGTKEARAPISPSSSARTATGLPTAMSRVPSGTRCFAMKPSSCASHSIVALSVSTSARICPGATASPGCFLHFVMFPCGKARGVGHCAPAETAQSVLL